MRRREFITLLGGAAPLWPLAASAQQPAVPVIGVLSVGSPDMANPDNDAAFERGLAERGYVVGRNVTIERRWARGNHDRLPELAQELVHLNPALIIGGGNVVALAARRATSTIPIVFIIASDPVKLGLAKSFAHPGGNATGISMMTATLVLKRLELIQELLQQNATVGFLVNPDNQDLLQEIEAIARSTGRPLEVAKARNPDDLEPAFRQLVSAQVGAVLVSNDAMLFYPACATCRIGQASFASGVLRIPRISGGRWPDELRAEPCRNFSKSRHLRRTYFRRCSAGRSAHSATYGVQFGSQLGNRALLRHPNPPIAARPCRRGDRIGTTSAAAHAPLSVRECHGCGRCGSFQCSENEPCRADPAMASRTAARDKFVASC